MNGAPSQVRTKPERERSNSPTAAAFARVLDARMRDLGADDVSFETIVASGPNGSRPHHTPADRTVAEIIGHHLHTDPIAPSQRAAAAGAHQAPEPVPADLERLIMQCLKKNPSERPASARALRDALRACTQVRPWTCDEATTWWRAFRSSTPAPAAASAISPGEERTMTVDIGDRLTQTAI